MSIHDRARADKPARNEVDAHVDVLQEGVSGAEQEHAGEQIPLHFGEGAGTHMKGLARDGVTGAEEDRRQDQPHDGPADAFVESVDQAG